MTPDLTKPDFGTPSKGAPVRPWSSTWVGYYDRASRRRHRMGGYKRIRALAKRRRRTQILRVAVAVLGVAMLVSIFYLILMRA